MITIHKNDTVVMIYGIRNAIEMEVRSLNTNTQAVIPLYPVSAGWGDARYTLYSMAYDPEVETQIISGVTHVNLTPGKYEYKIANIGEEPFAGILYIKDEKIESKVYEQENTTKVYKG